MWQLLCLLDYVQILGPNDITNTRWQHLYLGYLLLLYYFCGILLKVKLIRRLI